MEVELFGVQGSVRVLASPSALAERIKATGRRLGFDRVALLGHSLGGVNPANSGDLSSSWPLSAFRIIS